MRRAAAALAALALLGAAPMPDANCRLRHSELRVYSLAKLPANIRQALIAIAGPMADRGQPFNATDVVTKRAPFNRFIRADAYSEYWSVWYEHGGIAYWKQIVILDQEIGLHLATQQRATSPDLCADTDRIYDKMLP